MPQFVWKSDTITVHNGTVSVLAFIETIAAITVSLWVGIKYNYWNHIVISATLAPLLLLRSDVSNDIGIQKLLSIGKEKSGYESHAGQYLIGFLLVTWALIQIILIRVYSVLRSIFILRTKVLLNIPKNWRLVALCVDTFHPPEVVAGIETYSKENPSKIIAKELTISSLVNRYKSLNKYKPTHIKILRTAVYGWVVFCLFVPSVALRWSLKSSSIVYFPFIYFSKDIGMSPTTPYSRFMRIVDAKAAIVWAIAGVWLILTIIPILFATLIDAAVNSQDVTLIVRELLNYFTFTPKIERWNVVRLVCATITIIMFLIAKYCISRYSSIEGAYIRLSDSLIKILDIIRAIGVVYLSLCAFLFVWYLLGKIDFSSVYILIPELGTDWLPIHNR